MTVRFPNSSQGALGDYRNLFHQNTHHSSSLQESSSGTSKEHICNNQAHNAERREKNTK